MAILQKHAKLRVCASCEWIFTANGEGCPKCGFAHYGARYVYGDKAYRYAKSQKPWFDRKMNSYALSLHKEIEDSKTVVKYSVLEKLIWSNT